MVSKTAAFQTEVIFNAVCFSVNDRMSNRAESRKQTEKPESITPTFFLTDHFNPIYGLKPALHTLNWGKEMRTVIRSQRPFPKNIADITC